MISKSQIFGSERLQSILAERSFSLRILCAERYISNPTRSRTQRYKINRLLMIILTFQILDEIEKQYELSLLLFSVDP